MENQLMVIVKESGLEKNKANFILEQFQDYFKIAAEWEEKAKTLVVTNESQVAEMKMAKTGRLFLREKRIAVEKARKNLKEQALREGKAIDGIANVLKALIVPIEEYLDKQEKFVEIQAEIKAEAKRIEEEKQLAEQERIAEEERIKEQERIRVENERLKKEAETREKHIAEERKIHDEILAKERAKADEERKASEEKARLEREKQDKILAEERAKAEDGRKKVEEKARQEQEAREKQQAVEAEKRRKEQEKVQANIEAERKEKERLAELLKNQIECPNCHHKFQIERG